jgi:hypothetical protein
MFKIIVVDFNSSSNAFQIDRYYYILYDISANSDMSPTTTTAKKEINQGCKHN